MKVNVLIVEDDPSTAQEIISICLDLQLSVHYSASLDAALLILAERNDFAIALIDLMLPPLFRNEGLLVLQEVARATEATTVMFSARQDSMISIVDQARSLGARKFIDKNAGNLATSLRTELKRALKEMSDSVFISHGHNEVLKLKLKDFVTSKLKRKVLILSEYPDRGMTIIEKLEAASNTCDCAIILMSSDDLQLNGGQRARQNVIHELGFFQGKYGRSKTILLVENGIEICSNISGIVRTEFDRDHFEACFERLRIELR
jgi:predicted nucleotide-binding protein